MKNKWFMLPVALLAVFGLAFMGCGGGSTTSGDDDGKIDPNKNYATGLGGIILEDNFRYGNGYQSWADEAKEIAWSKLGNVDIKAGDTFDFKVKFTLDRDLEDPLYVAFVNQPSAGSWDPMTGDEWVSVETGELVKIPNDMNNLAGPGIYTAGTAIEKEFSVTATKSARASTAVLVFQTRGVGIKEQAGSGDKGPAIMTFSEIFISSGEAQTIEPNHKVRLEKPATGNVELGLPPDWVNGDTQKGWRCDGFEGNVGGPTAAQFVWATKLVLVCDEPAGGVQLVWQGDGQSGWNQTQPVADNGTPVEGMASYEGGKLTFNLATALTKYDGISEDGEEEGYIWCQEAVKLLVAYYTGAGFDALGVTEAYLVIE